MACRVGVSGFKGRIAYLEARGSGVMWWISTFWLARTLQEAQQNVMHVYACTPHVMHVYAWGLGGECFVHAGSAWVTAQHLLSGVTRAALLVESSLWSPYSCLVAAPLSQQGCAFWSCRSRCYCQHSCHHMGVIGHASVEQCMV